MSLVGLINSKFARLRESPTVYDDWRWAGSGVNPPGAASPATLSEIATNQWGWVFVNNNVMIFPDQQIPHDYAEGTEIVPHIHFASTTSATYTGTWTLVITDWLSVADGSARQAQQTVTAAFNKAMTAHQAQLLNFSANMPGAGRLISSCATFYLSLALSAGTSLYLLGLDGHYQKDALGSRQITSKD
jgi:hypothetical protein